MIMIPHLINRPEAALITGFSVTDIHRREKDGDSPESHRTGPRAGAYVLSDVINWKFADSCESANSCGRPVRLSIETWIRPTERARARLHAVRRPDQGVA